MRRAEAGIQVDKFYPPTDWLDNNSKQIDIRKNAENNSIVLLVGHSADFSKYSLLGLLANTSSGTYDVYIDDVLVGSGITKNTQYDIDFSTINTSYGSATTPESLVLHKVVIKPTTSGSTITRFCGTQTTGSTGVQVTGVLWCHFELDNSININELCDKSAINEHSWNIVIAITAKNDIINISGDIRCLCRNCFFLEYLPFLNNPNYITFNINTSQSFQSCETIKRIRINSLNYCKAYSFYVNRALEQINTKQPLTYVSDSMSFLFEDDRNLKMLPFNKIEAYPNSNVIGTSAFRYLNKLYPTKLDMTELSKLQNINVNGNSATPMRGLRGLKVSNEAPFSGSSPQINVSYTGLDRDALVELFNSLPQVTGSQILKCDHCTGTADLTEADKQIATDKGWGLTLS